MSDNISLLAAAAAIIIIKRRRRRREQRSKRSLWCQQWLSERCSEKGVGNFVLNELLTGDIVGFKGFLRMTPDVFNELLAKIEPHIRRSDTIMRDSITPHAVAARGGVRGGQLSPGASGGGAPQAPPPEFFFTFICTTPYRLQQCSIHAVVYKIYCIFCIYT
jgi:hypothetical protein